MARVLVIDDDRHFATGAAEELRLAGFKADYALSYTEAIERLKSVHYDVVSLDIMMPIEPHESIYEQVDSGRQTGLLIYRELRRLSPDTKVVVFSVLAAEDKGYQAIVEGVDPGTRIVKKPVKVDPYLDEIRIASEQ